MTMNYELVIAVYVDTSKYLVVKKSSKKEAFRSRASFINTLRTTYTFTESMCGYASRCSNKCESFRNNRYVRYV